MRGALHLLADSEPTYFASWRLQFAALMFGQMDQFSGPPVHIVEINVNNSRQCNLARKKKFG
jgi:hypothetical protein